MGPERLRSPPHRLTERPSSPARIIQANALHSKPNSLEIRAAAVMCVASRFSRLVLGAENADSMPHLSRAFSRLKSSWGSQFRDVRAGRQLRDPVPLGPA